MKFQAASQAPTDPDATIRALLVARQLFNNWCNDRQRAIRQHFGVMMAMLVQPVRTRRLRTSHTRLRLHVYEAYGMQAVVALLRSRLQAGVADQND